MAAHWVLRTSTGVVGALLMACGAYAQQPSTGPGVQAPRDANYPGFIASHCQHPPALMALPSRPVPTAPRPHQAYAVAAIPGVIAAGETWKTVWTGTGNNADGPIPTADGGMLFAQNSDSKVMRLGAGGEVSYPFADTNTGGALSRSKHGALYIVARGLPQSIWQLEPTRRVLANQYQGEPLDCAGNVLNDLAADSRGGAYFTMGAVYYADARGRVTRYGSLTGANGIVLSRDEKTLYVTGRLAGAGAPATPAVPGARPGGLVAYDVQPDGALTNERQFALVGDDGSAIDGQGRIYTPGGGGVQVVGTDGSVLGEIPSPLPLITVAFGGPHKRTLYAVANDQHFVEIFAIDLLAQGYLGRAK